MNKSSIYVFNSMVMLWFLVLKFNHGRIYVLQSGHINHCTSTYTSHKLLPKFRCFNLFLYFLWMCMYCPQQGHIISDSCSGLKPSNISTSFSSQLLPLVIFLLKLVLVLMNPFNVLGRNRISLFGVCIVTDVFV